MYLIQQPLLPVSRQTTFLPGIAAEVNDLTVLADAKERCSPVSCELRNIKPSFAEGLQALAIERIGGGVVSPPGSQHDVNAAVDVTPIHNANVKGRNRWLSPPEAYPVDMKILFGLPKIVTFDTVIPSAMP